jgi:arylsulfatase A-like enzyme
MPARRRLLPLLAAAAAGAAAPLRPNIMWIMSDDLGYGEVRQRGERRLRVKPAAARSSMPRPRIRHPAPTTPPCSSPHPTPRPSPCAQISAMPGRTNTNITTPRIDALFASGWTFTDAYAGEAVCAPSRATLMTGRHTGHTHIRGNAGSNGHDLPLLANETTVLQVLREHAGYHVACVGKWGLGWWDSTGSPTLKGCDTYYGVLGQNDAHNMYPSEANFTWRYPASNGSAVWESLPFPANVNASRDRCMATGNTCVWSQNLWTAAALDALDGHAARVAALGAAAPPLFLYVAYTTPHAGGWSGIVEQGNPVPSDGDFAKYTAWPPAERDHASVIANFQDRDVGTLVDALAAHGLTNSTLVAFASDNGASDEGNHDYMFFGSSGPLRGFKRCLTEGGIRTPLGVSWPGVIPAGGVTNYTAAFWDFMPTFLELAGVPPAQWPETDGTSLVPLLTGSPEAQPAHPPLYWEFCTGACAWAAGRRAGGERVRTGRRCARAAVPPAL